MTRLDGGGVVGGDRSQASPAPVRIVWLRLRLQGFGRHRDTTLRFPEGLVTTVAGNERGKSTAVLGLIATVWGVPHGGDRQGFTWTRFRASSGAPHRGEVEFRRGDVHYRLERDFETHRVRVVRDDGAPLEIIDAEHNPQARRGHGVVPAWLRATFGIDDASLVLATFVWAGDQLGGPGDRVGPGVQALLTGAGGGTAHEAIERLGGSANDPSAQFTALAERFFRLDESLVALPPQRSFEAVDTLDVVVTGPPRRHCRTAPPWPRRPRRAPTPRA